MKYILIAVILLSCNSQKRNIPVSTEKLDTISPVTVASAATPALFETAFIKGTTQTINNKPFSLYGVTIGKIKITSGRITVCDPLHIDEYGKPFTRIFPTGEFPVQLSIAKMGDEEVTAFARINFSDEPVVKWEFALLEGQSAIPVGGSETHEYCVDAGVGIFMDEEAIKALDIQKIQEMESKSDLFKEMEKHYHATWRFALYNFGQYNLAAFTTGFGDGCYSTYIGFDAKGNPCRLLTDFNLFDWRQSKK